MKLNKMKTIVLSLVMLLTAEAFGQWKRVKNDDFEQCVAVDSKTSFAMGLHRLWKSVDGGDTWQEMDVAGDTINLAAIGFISEKVGYVVSYSDWSQRLYKTTDGAVSWEEVNIPPFTPIRSIHLINEQVGIFQVSSNYLLTIDGGKSFTEFYAPFNPYFGSIHFFDEKRGVIGGRDAFSSTDGTRVYSKEQIVYTEDGGKNWTITYEDTTFYQSVDEYQVQLTKSIVRFYFVDNLKGVALSANGTMLKTTDAGLHWNVFSKLPDTLLYCHDIAFEENLQVGYVTAYTGIGVAFGVQNFVYKTTDGGLTWKQDINLGTGASRSRLSSVKDQIVYATAFNGLYRSKPGPNGIPKNSESQFVIYPNPVNRYDELTISKNGNDRSATFSNALDITLIDISGRVVASLRMNSATQTLPLTNVAQGVYNLHIKENGSGNISVNKLVITE
jgi:photosystem II stability/assembly factor-like uncharacterized protein